MKVGREAIIGRFFGIGSGLAYGLSSALIKKGVTTLAPPLVGVALALFSATLILALIEARNLGKAHLGQSKKSVAFFLAAGIVTGLGATSQYFALSVAPVVIVNPLQSTNPLFTLLWSHLFLGHLERITPKLIVGSFLVVVGAVLVALGRNL